MTDLRDDSCYNCDANSLYYLNILESNLVQVQIKGQEMATREKGKKLRKLLFFCGILDGNDRWVAVGGLHSEMTITLG